MLNKVQFIGNLGKDPEVKVTSNERKLATFSIATNEQYKDINGEKQQITDWHRIVAFGKLAEIIEKYVKKGSKVYIEGKQKTRSYEDKEGNKKYITEVIANEMKMLNKVSQEDSGYKPDEQNAGTDSIGPGPGLNNGAKAPEFDSEQPDGDDDLPF